MMFNLVPSFKRTSNSNSFPGTITKVDWDNENYKPENTPEYYYNYQEAVPIEDVLEPWVKRFVDLEWIPWNGPGSETGEILRADWDKEEDGVHVSWPFFSTLVLIVTCFFE